MLASDPKTAVNVIHYHPAGGEVNSPNREVFVQISVKFKLLPHGPIACVKCREKRVLTTLSWEPTLLSESEIMMKSSAEDVGVSRQSRLYPCD